MSSSCSSLISLLLLLCLVVPSSGRQLADDRYNGSGFRSRRHHHHQQEQQQQRPFSGGHYVFVPKAPQWNRKLGRRPRILTYALSLEHSYDYLSREEILAALQRALGRWEAVIPLRFQETSDFWKADVKVGFYEGEPGGMLAYAYPMTEWYGTYVNIDAMEHWTTDLAKDGDKQAMDLETVIVHELGHVLGLGHTTTARAVMYPTFSWRETKVELDEEDIQGVQELFRLKPSISWKTATLHEAKVNCYRFQRCGFFWSIMAAVLLLFAAVSLHILWCIEINCSRLLVKQGEEEKGKEI